MAAFFEDDRNSSAESDFFSPISASFFRPKSSSSRVNNTGEIHHQQGEQQGSGEKLQPLHDSSWIGARLSPIGQSFDNESADEDDAGDGQFTSVYHRALHESFENAEFIVATERTRLLAFRPPSSSLASTGATKRNGINNKSSKSGIHPLWNHPESTASQKRGTKDVHLSWGAVVCSLSGLFFVTMGITDYYKYSSSQISAANVESVSWTLPWIMPSSETMLSFGAFVPVLNFEYLWRPVASSFMCSSVVEYIAVLGAWRIISMIKSPHGPRDPWYRWSGIYVASCVVGQLWMVAWDRTYGATTGCVAWSTCGVLTYIGMQSLSRRMIFFFTAATLLALSLVQRPYSSVIGTVGASFLGWSLAAAEVTSLPSWSHRRPNGYNPEGKPSWVCWLGRILAVKIVVLPTLFISFLF